MSFVSCSKLAAELAATEAAAAAYTDSAVADAVNSIPSATDTTAGVVKLNQGSSLPSDATNNTDGLTASGVNTLLNDVATTGGNAMQKAVVNAVGQAIGSDAGAQTAIAGAVKEEVAAAIAADPASAAALMPGVIDALLADPAKLQELANALSTIIPDVFE